MPIFYEGTHFHSLIHQSPGRPGLGYYRGHRDVRGIVPAEQYSVVPNLFGQGPVSWKTIFPWTRVWG